MTACPRAIPATGSRWPETTRPDSRQSAPPCDAAPSAPSTGSPGRTRTGKVPGRADPRSASALEQYFLTGPRWPLSENLLPLPRAYTELAETVHRYIQSQEIFQYGGEQIHSAAHKLVFVELHLHLRAAREHHAVFGNHAGEVPPAVQPGQPLNLLFGIGGPREVVEPQNLLQCFPAVFHQREIVERELRHQPPHGILAHRRPQRIGRLDQR